MNINATSPSFQGFIKINKTKTGMHPDSTDWKKTDETILNTNNITIERTIYDKEDDNGSINNYAKIITPNKEYSCNDYQALCKAIKLAEQNPGKIIDVDKCRQNQTDYII